MERTFNAHFWRIAPDIRVYVALANWWNGDELGGLFIQHSRRQGLSSPFGPFSFTEYFENEVLRKRPYLRREWCIAVVRSPVRNEPQAYGRHRFWGAIPALGGRYLRVITLADRVTIHNAFPDRRFRP